MEKRHGTILLYCNFCDKTLGVTDDLNEHTDGNLTTCDKELITKKFCTVHMKGVMEQYS